MPTIMVKNIPDELYEKLRATARKNRRSIDSEIIMCLESTLQSRRVNPDEFLRRAEKLRQTLALTPPDDVFLRKAREEGRRFSEFTE